MSKSVLDRINYFVALITEFAKAHHISTSQAYRILALIVMFSVCGHVSAQTMNKKACAAELARITDVPYLPELSGDSLYTGWGNNLYVADEFMRGQSEKKP